MPRSTRTRYRRGLFFSSPHKAYNPVQSIQQYLALLRRSSGLFLNNCAALQRQCLFYPTFHTQDNGLAPWRANGRLLGYSRPNPSPKVVWLLLHGNAGQAADRAYALPCFSANDAVYILEYPGYGQRKGSPSKTSINAAARQAYRLLRQRHPQLPLCVVGESLGSGPACALASPGAGPEKIVLVVPFDTLANVAAYHLGLPSMPLFLEANWNNIRALSSYEGRVEIFAAEEDAIVPMQHAENLARHLPRSVFHRIPGGHGDWPCHGLVRFRYP